MTSIFTALAAHGPWFGAAIGLAVGLVLGFVHFGALWWTARAYAEGGLGRPLAAQILRFALLGVVLWALARIGAPALLAGALGFLAARFVVVRRVGRLT